MIIDVHTHIYADIIAKKTVEALASVVNITPFTNGTLSDTLDKYQKAGIDKLCALNIAVKPNKEDKLNVYAKSIDSDTVISFASVNPNSDNVGASLEFVLEKGFKGIKLHPEYQRFDADDRKAFVIYEFAQKHGIPITFHAGDDGAYPNSTMGHPYKLARVLDKFPDMKVIFAHMGGMTKWKEVREVLVGRDCYFDTAFCASLMADDIFCDFVELHGADKILFGSDCPWESPIKTIEYIKKNVVTQEKIDKILYQNAVNLFGI